MLLLLVFHLPFLVIVICLMFIYSKKKKIANDIWRQNEPLEQRTNTKFDDSLKGNSQVGDPVPVPLLSSLRADSRSIRIVLHEYFFITKVIPILHYVKSTHLKLLHLLNCV